MFDEVMARIAGRFGRVEPRATARGYLLGLLSSVERKNCWQLAEQAGHTRPGPMQRLLRYARWDADAVRDDLRAYAAEHLGADGGVLVVDETGFLKKGRSSAGVQRQYTGTAGRIENTQVGVFLALATSRGRALIDRRLYLPEHSWANDPERRTAAGIPETVQFATKPRLAAEMITAALDAGITASWVTGDEAYGQDPQLRAALEARGTGYVMAAACSMRVRINHGRTLVRADTVVGRLPTTAWQRHSAGNGAKGVLPAVWTSTRTSVDGCCTRCQPNPPGLVASSGRARGRTVLASSTRTVTVAGPAVIRYPVTPPACRTALVNSSDTTSSTASTASPPSGAATRRNPRAASLACSADSSDHPGKAVLAAAAMRPSTHVDVPSFLHNLPYAAAAGSVPRRPHPRCHWHRSFPQGIPAGHGAPGRVRRD